MSKLKIITPETNIIEKTAAEFAGVWFDAARNSGIKIARLQGQVINLLKYKNNPRLFAKAHLEKFIPAATHALMEILCRDSTPLDQKEIIYKAITERTGDEQLNTMGKAAGLPAYENTVLYKKDDVKPLPVIINTPNIKDVLDG
jgi:hypothetical protein